MRITKTTKQIIVDSAVSALMFSVITLALSLIVLSVYMCVYEKNYLFLALIPFGVFILSAITDVMANRDVNKANSIS